MDAIHYRCADVDGADGAVAFTADAPGAKTCLLDGADWRHRMPVLSVDVAMPNKGGR
jgi:hypothetical protein